MGYLKKFFYVFSGHRAQILMLLMVFLMTSVLEAFGIGLIGPFLTLASSPAQIQDISSLASIYQWLGLRQENTLVMLLGIVIIIVFFLKSILYLAGRVFTFKTIFGQRMAVQKRLFNSYMYAPYEFHLGHNTANLINKISTETNRFTYLVSIPLAELCSQAIVVIILVGLLAKTNFILFALVLTTLLPAFLVFSVLSKHLKEWGKQGSIAREGILRTIGHGFGGVKETRIIGCENFFQQQLNQQISQEIHTETLFQSSQYIPRTLIETILVVTVIGFVCISLFSGEQSFQNSIAAMGVFAVASIRLVPAASQLVEGLGKLRNSIHSLDVLYFDLKEIETQQFGANSVDRSLQEATSSLRLPSPMSFTRELELRELVYHYPGVEAPSLNKISACIKRGESIGLIGKSGAGKTTLVDVILSLLIPESGDIQVDGHSIYQNLAAWKQLIGYIPQSIFLMDDTIERNIAFGVPDDQIDSKRLWYAIQSAQIEGLIEDLPEGIYTSVGERGVRLSGGQRQRIGIARALYHQREILVLDEATSALDNETEKLISDSIRSLAGSKTLIIIAHRLSTLEYCDRIFELEKGRVVRVGSYHDIVLTQNR